MLLNCSLYVFSGTVAPVTLSWKQLSGAMLHDSASRTVVVMWSLKTHDRKSLGLALQVCSQFSVLACEDWLIADSGVAKLEDPGVRR